MRHKNDSGREAVTVTTTHSLTPLVGFSAKINDLAFARYRRDAKRWSFLFSFSLAAIAIIAFPIYGNQTGEIDWPDSLFYGVGIGGMFVLIAALQTFKRNLDKTWDGVVILKESRRIRKRVGNTIGYHTEYIIQVQKEDGRVKKHRWLDAPGIFNYYSVGDKVRHHRGFAYYEKYNKSKDAAIMCAACNTFNDISLEVCRRCRCPLLK